MLGIVQLNLTDAKWFANSTAMTGYVFAGFVFWMFCFGMSRYSQLIERRLAAGRPALIAGSPYAAGEQLSDPATAALRPCR